MAHDVNSRVIKEFRANGGKVSGPAEGSSLLLLHHEGAKSGTERVSPLAYQPLSDAWAVFAVDTGAPRYPAWYYNIVANPETFIEIGTDTIAVRVRVANGDERERIWSHQKASYPRFAKFEQRTTRQIPVVILERLSSRRPGSRGLDVK